MKKLIALIAASFIITVNAATLNYTNSYSGSSDFVQDIPIPQFNPVLGNLRSVIVQAQFVEDRTVFAENLSAGNQWFSFLMTNNINISIPNATDINTNAYTSYSLIRRVVAPYDGVIDYAGTSGATVSKTSTNAISVTITNISQFTGYSIIPVHTAAVGRMSWSFSGGSGAIYTKNIVEIRIFVQYIYDPCVVVYYYQDRKFKKLV